MEKLKLSEYLRYGFSGGVALLTLVLTYPQTVNLLPTNGKLAQTTLVAGLILLIGIFIYSIHRALFYPIIYRIILSKVYDCKFEPAFLVPYKFSNKEIELNFERWRRRHDDKNPYQS